MCHLALPVFSMRCTGAVHGSQKTVSSPSSANGSWATKSRHYRRGGLSSRRRTSTLCTYRRRAPAFPIMRTYTTRNPFSASVQGLHSYILAHPFPGHLHPILPHKHPALAYPIHPDLPPGARTHWQCYYSRRKGRT
ncbi:hypothetical protein L226DRAFT_107638 [Lentinus tigrinus ALCF2SS1-7]|uniref:uncharacterized protein n=1 Tax=Lentinus tigrinus ALCF2SS1-7 TaxID=1328758 RepID=UPI001165D961|nr:hypothetical protein L226DRAFT_107638 [Lentinus tigrinus ALCF2SS1-7]